METGSPEHWKSFEELFAAYTKQLKYFIDIKIRGNIIIEQMWSRYLPAPFLSILIDDCIEKRKDYHSGGARYNTSYIQGVGLGTITDALSALKFHVFDQRNCTMKEVLKALGDNFAGHEKLHELFLAETPKYGNDDDHADDIMKQVFNTYFDSVAGRPNTRGGFFRINMLPTTCHVYFGSVIGATPDGRPAEVPLSEDISPVQGADRNGPTGVIKSASKMDHLRTGGILLNQKFTLQFLENDGAREKVLKVIRTYFNMYGHHIQFNVVKAETLKDAQIHPEKHTDLIVRVAGYSDYFIDLSTDLQNEIIQRTEHAPV